MSQLTAREIAEKTNEVINELNIDMKKLFKPDQAKVKTEIAAAIIKRDTVC